MEFPYLRFSTLKVFISPESIVAKQTGYNKLINLTINIGYIVNIYIITKWETREIIQSTELAFRVIVLGQISAGRHRTILHAITAECQEAVKVNNAGWLTYNVDCC